jgi:hypothetical protein
MSRSRFGGSMICRKCGGFAPETSYFDGYRCSQCDWEVKHKDIIKTCVECIYLKYTLSEYDGEHKIDWCSLFSKDIMNESVIGEPKPLTSNCRTTKDW